MFHVNRWSGVFMTALGENAGEGLACLKALVTPLKAASVVLTGYSAARQLEQMLRESAAACGGDAFNGDAVEYAIRFITLVVEKKRFSNIDLIMRHIEQCLDARAGVLAVIVESAVPVDDDFAEEFRRQIMERLGAAKITMQVRLAPELLGGYRLRVGGFYVDASLRGQMEEMKSDLEAVI